MSANIYETGRLFELQRITSVEDRPGEGGKGVGLQYGDLQAEGEGSMRTWDSRFTAEDIGPGDIVRIEFEGPSLGSITEVFREGLRIFPEPEGRLPRLQKAAEFKKDLREDLTS